MTVLADSSIWVDHLRFGNAQMGMLLEKGVIRTHEFVLGELACGNLPHRDQFIRDVDLLPKSPAVPHGEASAFVEMHRLFGQGLGWIDVHLLASALVSGARLWTLDKALRKAAEKLRIAF